MNPSQIATFIANLPETLPPDAPRHHLSRKTITPEHFQMRNDPLPRRFIVEAMKAGGWTP
jgi:hypothetical protein